ncbi:MAG: hypothetical protein PUF72_09060 [Clostridiales bacterium]|nr:hypothetical protein [Clostridiales bacterium]
MLKKLLAAVCTATMLIIPQAYAQEYITGQITDKGIVFDKIPGELLILNGYKDKKLCYSGGFEVTEGKAVSDAPAMELDSLWAVYGNDFEKVSEVKLLEPLPEPSPEPTANPQYPWKDAPAVYGSEKNAFYAPSVITSVSSVTRDGETGCKLEYMYLGREGSIFAPDTAQISAASDDSAYLIGQSVSALKRGDTVYIERDMYGDVKTIGLICRAPSSSLLLDGKDYGVSFEKYISQNGYAANAAAWGVVSYISKVTKADYQYAFGLVGRRDGTVLYLMNNSASIDNALELTMDEDCVVYVCDASRKGEVSVEKISSITSNIPSSVWNKGGTIEYDTDNTGSYALVRLVKGIAADIVFYTGY